MGRTAKRKKRINPGRLVLTVIVVVLLFLAAVSVKNILTLHIENKELTEQNARLEDEKNQLQNELDNADDPKYIEEQARRQLRMVMPGEVLYIIEEEGENAKAAAESDSADTPDDGSAESGEGNE